MSMYLSHGPALSAQRSYATSALPDAPVLPYVEPRPHTTATAVRRTVSTGLHRLADRIAPAPKELAARELAC
jgi:hypothetical protein